MSSVQKVIKILAIALAIFIIVNIFSAIIFGISIFSNIMHSAKYENTDGTTYEIISENIDKIETLKENVKLKIDLEISNLEIKEGEKFSVEKINVENNLKCKVVENTLEIEEKDYNWFNTQNNTNSTIIVTVPKDMILNEVKISNGIGKMEMKNIKTSKLELDTGVGITILDNIVAQKTDIDGGAGNLSINNSILVDLDLDCGVGSTKISGDIKGNSKISCGVGKTELDLVQNIESYNIETEVGIGTISINGENCVNNSKYGNGENSIKIEGGVGNVNITTK